MAARIQIRTDTDNCIHFDTGKNGYTLCGLETQGDPEIGIMTGKPTTRRADCPTCISIITFCRSIKRGEYKQEQNNGR